MNGVTGAPTAVVVLGATNLRPDLRPARGSDMTPLSDVVSSLELAEQRRAAVVWRDKEGRPDPITGILERCAPPPAHLVLLATDQDPGHPLDTLCVAKLIKDVWLKDPCVFGSSIDAIDIIQLNGFGLAATAGAVAGSQAISVVPPPLLPMVAGPVEVWLGALVGLLRRGVLPTIHPVNVQTTQLPQPFKWDRPEDLMPWLVRNAAFSVLADTVEDDEVGEYLRAVSTLSWAALDQVDLAGHGELGQWKRRLGGQRADWEALADTIGALLLRRVDAGSTREAMFLARSWIEAEAHRMLNDSSLEIGIDYWRGLLAADGSFDRLIKKHRDRFDGFCFPDDAIGRFLAGCIDLWEMAAPFDHGQPGPPWDQVRAAVEQVANRYGRKRDPFTPALETIGLEPWTPFSTAGAAVLMTVGKRSEAVDAAAEALLRRLGNEVDLKKTDIRLVATKETEPTADELRRALSRRVRSAKLIEPPVDVVDPNAAYATISDALKGERLMRDVGEVVLAANMGTKAMNLATLAAASRWAFDLNLPVRALFLRRDEDVGTVVVDDPTAGFVARLAHDGAVGTTAAAAVRRQDFDLARAILERGSPLWNRASAAVDRIGRLCRHGAADDEVVVPGPDTNLADMADASDGLKCRVGDLWSARVDLAIELKWSDPWRALYGLVASAEECWRSSPPDIPAWRNDTGKACRALWRWRNHSPYGHYPHVREFPKGFDGLALGSIDELRAGGLVRKVDSRIDLVGLIDKVATAIEKVDVSLVR